MIFNRNYVLIKTSLANISKTKRIAKFLFTKKALTIILK